MKPDYELYRNYVLDWLKDEAQYQANKFGDGNFAENDIKRTPQFGYQRKNFDTPYEDTYWYNQLNQYLHRAYVLGVDTPVGRQALAKFAATALGLVESAVRVYGELPEPGVTSGENLDRLRPLRSVQDESRS